MKRIRIFLLALLALAFAAPARAADVEKFKSFSAESAAVVDHHLWAAFLSAYVRAPAALGAPALVAYGAVTPADRASLKAYVESLERVRPETLNHDEAFAYWANLYNAATVSLILDHYPLKSITKIKTSLISFGPWDMTAATVDGVALSFNDIEHKILRAGFHDNRVHYALNCASLGCPDLKATPWAAATLNADLDAAARNYVNSPRGVAVANGKVSASSIYKWFGEDFGGDDAGRLAHFRRYANPPLKAALEKAEKISDYSYNWSLNEAK